jgi:hypothetical protein
MTFQQYKVLSLGEQKMVLWLAGDFVIDRMEGIYSILLYQVYSFYVEVWFEAKKNKIEKIASFSNMKRLEPYLNKIDISYLSQRQ